MADQPDVGNPDEEVKAEGPQDEAAQESGPGEANVEEAKVAEPKVEDPKVEEPKQVKEPTEDAQAEKPTTQTGETQDAPAKPEAQNLQQEGDARTKEPPSEFDAIRDDDTMKEYVEEGSETEEKALSPEEIRKSIVEAIMARQSTSAEAKDDVPIVPKGTKKDLYFTPVYNKEKLFTSIKDTSGAKKHAAKDEFNVAIGNLRKSIEPEISPSDQKRASLGYRELSREKIENIKPLGIGDVKVSTSTVSTTTTTISEPMEPQQTDVYKTSIKYLMKLIPYWDDQEEEGNEEIQVEEEEKMQGTYEETQESGTTESMRQAQRYLRVHRIFEFIQFLTAHLLSACPDNPIDYLLEVLDKCLIYRAGFTDAPVLYTKKHIGCLFNLMDRMRTGFIEPEQYRVGMTTLGICSCNENPPLTRDGMVTKEYFTEEAYENLCRLLDDMLRRRWLNEKPPITFKSTAVSPQNISLPPLRSARRLVRRR